MGKVGRRGVRDRVGARRARTEEETGRRLAIDAYRADYYVKLQLRRVRMGAAYIDMDTGILWDKVGNWHDDKQDWRKWLDEEQNPALNDGTKGMTD